MQPRALKNKLAQKNFLFTEADIEKSMPGTKNDRQEQLVTSLISSIKQKVHFDEAKGTYPHEIPYQEAEALEKQAKTAIDSTIREALFREAAALYYQSWLKGSIKAANKFTYKPDELQSQNEINLFLPPFSPEKIFYTGLVHWLGLNGKKDIAKAIRCLEQSAAQKNHHAINLLGYYYLNDDCGVKADRNKAFLLFKEAAELGSTVALNNLGFIYALGYGIKKDREEALKYYQLAANQGFSLAFLSLGNFFSSQESIQYYQQAAEQGIALAQYYLGGYYYEKKNPEKAFQYYQQAATQELMAAQFTLGFCYRKGIGTKKNSIEGCKWLKQAAEQGDAVSQEYLGLSYEVGAGVEQDLNKAFLLYKKAATQGNIRAILSLGRFYLTYKDNNYNRDYIGNLVKGIDLLQQVLEQNIRQAKELLISPVNTNRGFKALKYLIEGKLITHCAAKKLIKSPENRRIIDSIIESNIEKGQSVVLEGLKKLAPSNDKRSLYTLSPLFFSYVGINTNSQKSLEDNKNQVQRP